MFLDSIFRKRRYRAPAAALYDVLVGQARMPWFYLDLGVPDTAEGRFEMVSVHAFLVLNRLKLALGAGPSEADDLGQAIFDLMFADMDRNLREMGTGDLGVAKRVKSLAAGFFGRIAAYEEGLNGEAGLLESALLRNVYGGVARDGAAEAMAAYLKSSAGCLKELTFDEILDGRLCFGPVPNRSAAHAGSAS
jgi:cytochrome b pre-mRNA-processing protein 3